MYRADFIPNELDPFGMASLCCEIAGPMSFPGGISVPTTGHQKVEKQCDCDSLGGKIVSFIKCISIFSTGTSVGGVQIDIGIGIGGPTNPDPRPNNKPKPKPNPKPTLPPVVVSVDVTF